MKITSLTLIKNTAHMLAILIAGTQMAHSVPCNQKALGECVQKIMQEATAGKENHQRWAPTFIAFRGYQQKCASQLGCELPEKKRPEETEADGKTAELPKKVIGEREERE